MKLAIMQPYFFPYIGYFQLIHSVDKFVFYDDVNYIKNGWINRNRILVNNKPIYLTVQLKDASPFKPINQVMFSDNRPKMKKTILMAYKKAPFFDDAWTVIESCLSFETNNISELAMCSVKEVCKYLNISVIINVSSQNYSDTKKFERTERIIQICKKNGAQTYINAEGGKELYSKKTFGDHGIRMNFIKSKPIVYQQYKEPFFPWLSIIDVLMFNSVEKIHNILSDYELL